MRVSNFLKYALASVALVGAANVGAMEYADLSVTVTPEVIPANYSGEIEMSFTMNGEWAEYADPYAGSFWTGTPLTVKTEVGMKYTDVYIQHMFDQAEGTYLCLFDKALAEGKYLIDVPAGALRRVDQDGVIYRQNNATTISLTVGEAEEPGPEPEVGFTPLRTYPEAGTYVDKGNPDWIISLFFSEKVTVNPDVVPYIFLNDLSIEADRFMSLAFLSAPKQANVYFDGMNNRPNGTYTFVLPKGALSYEDGQTNATFTTTFEWNGGKNEGGGDDVDMSIISATLNGYDIMTPGQVLPNLPAKNDDCKLKIAVNPQTVQGLWLKIIDVTGLQPEQYGNPMNESPWSNEIERIDENSPKADQIEKDPQGNYIFSKSIYTIEEIKLYNDKTYVVEVQLYNSKEPLSDLIGTLYTETFTGMTEPYRYSNAEIVSISPEPGTEFTTSDELVVTFSEPVNLNVGNNKSGFHNGNQGFAAFKTAKSNDDKTVWTFTFPASQFAMAGGPSQLSPVLMGTDLNGLTLRPAQYDVAEGEGVYVFNIGFEAGSGVQINYDCYANCAKVNVAPTVAESISYLDFSIDDTSDIAIAPSYQAALPVIKNADGEQVAVVLVDNYDTDEEEPGHITVIRGTTGNDAVNYELRIALNNPLTEAGIYTLELPWNIFVAGTEYNSRASAPETVKLVVTAGKPVTENLIFTSEEADKMATTYVPGEEEGEAGSYMITFESKEKVANVTITIPYGYDTVYYQDMMSAMSDRRRVSGAMLEEGGFTKGNVIPVPVDGVAHNYAIILAEGDEADMDTAMRLAIKAEKSVSVEDLAADAEDAEYFTVSGVKVVNPTEGLYIKIKNGKAEKVVL